MGFAVSSSHIISAAPSSSHSSPVPAWDPSHGTQSSVNFSNMSPSYGLQFFMNCSSVGPFHGVQSFGTWLLQRWSSTGPASSLLQRGLSTGSQHHLGIHLLLCGVLRGRQVDVCSTVDLHGLQGDSLPHHGLLHGPPGKLCSGACSTSSPSFLTDLGVCRVVSE